MIVTFAKVPSLLGEQERRHYVDRRYVRVDLQHPRGICLRRGKIKQSSFNSSSLDLLPL